MSAILAYVHRWRLNSKLAKSDRRKGLLFLRELSFGLVTLLRLQNSFLSESEKHPIILPKNHHVTVLLIRRAHISTLHGNYRLVHNYLLQKYWILRANTIIRRIVRNCVRCTRHNAITLEQQMAPLPAIRAKPALPFAHFGVDFAGYFCVKASSGRGQKTSKGYVAVFVCLVVKTIHLELVSDLTTDAFLAAYRRFTARRGLCQIIYSDNGITFKGSEAELHRLFSETSATGQAVAAAVTSDGVEWRYISPRALNFGGIWESNVRSIKRHLYRIIGNSKLTYKQLSTVLASTKACLNSRPISALSSDPNNASALTPGQFIIGKLLVAPPEPFTEINQPGQQCSGWRPLQLMRNHFWQRWRYLAEYLAQLQQRSKWLKPNRQLQVGDLVLFKDKLAPPTKWLLARVVRLHPEQNGLTRVATIRTSASELVQSTNNLILLPVHEKTISNFSQFESFMAVY
ncbi:uncharacterized protein LOC114946376 [Nylanderia fulva]|uniref:uncharacterized protein LOC114946376 n=1 Tax=Nylanderia fulva TaxID=613905 RepID=UPI0010FB5531|nr:uncharacterized protein LOC114946376 [Nylanderia fulva]